MLVFCHHYNIVNIIHKKELLPKKNLKNLQIQGKVQSFLFCNSFQTNK